MNNLSIVTFNTKWFFDDDKKQSAFIRTKKMTDKIDGILKLLYYEGAAIIALQEVEGYNNFTIFNEIYNADDIYNINYGREINSYHSIVLAELCAKFNDEYKKHNVNIYYKYSIGNADQSKQRVGVLIDVNRIENINTKIYMTKFGLKHLGVEFSFMSRNFFLLNVHLKSKLNNNKNKRKNQALEINKIIKNYIDDNIIVCGDFNVMDSTLGITDSDDCFSIIKSISNQSGGTYELCNVLSNLDKNILGDIETHFYDKNKNNKVDDGELSIIDTFLLKSNYKVSSIKSLINLKIGDRVKMISDHIPLSMKLLIE